MHPVVHFAMPYEERQRMATFYEAAFGWQTQLLAEDMGHYVLATTTDTDETGPKTPGAIHGGFFPKQPERPAQHPSIVIAVDDITDAVKRVTEAGGTVLGEPMEIPGVGHDVSCTDCKKVGETFCRSVFARVLFRESDQRAFHTPWRSVMTIRLDHTIVPATDKVAAAAFFADIFGLTVQPGSGHFAQVPVNESLTLDFADAPEPWGGPGFDPRTGQSHHYAFHVSEAEFEAIFGRVRARGLPYGSGPFTHTDDQLYTRRGGRGFYFEDPYGHLLEVMTVPETGS